jgi:hypothetical protein
MAKKAGAGEMNKYQTIREAVEKLGTGTGNDEVRTKVLKQSPQLNITG